MEIINTKNIASVELTEVLFSEDELEVFRTAIEFAIGKLSENEIENQFGATKDEVEGILEDIKTALANCRKDSLEMVLA